MNVSTPGRILAARRPAREAQTVTSARHGLHGLFPLCGRFLAFFFFFFLPFVHSLLLALSFVFLAAFVSQCQLLP